MPPAKPTPVVRRETRALFVYQARDLGYTFGEIAVRLGVSRWALRRELSRADREFERTGDRTCDCCGDPLPSFVTARRRFCDDACRVTFARWTRRSAGQRSGGS
jgi:hypothetical protein